MRISKEVARFTRHSLLVTPWKPTRYSLYDLLGLITSKPTRYHSKTYSLSLQTYSLYFKTYWLSLQNLLVITSKPTRYHSKTYSLSLQNLPEVFCDKIANISHLRTETTVTVKYLVGQRIQTSGGESR